MISPDTLYARSPAPLQNLLLTAFGWQQSRSRFAGVFPKQLELLLQLETLSSPDIRRLQDAQLQQLVVSSAKSVPYCQEVLSQAKIKPEKVNIDNFTHIFPVLDKETILRDPEKFLNDKLPKSEAIKLFTSGSSGSPLAILSSRTARQKNYAFYEAILRQYGLKYRDRSITFAGRTVVSPQSSSNFWRYDYYNQTMYCSSFHQSNDSIPHYIKAIEQWQPSFIDSYPSAIGEMARFILEHSISHRISPEFILTSSETLLASQRDAIEKAFQCPVIDQYGCTEMAIWAASEGKQYSVNPLYSLCELLPVAGENKAPIYEVVSTGLLNEAMPLFRYQIGDCVACSTPPEQQTFQQLQFDQVLGRQDDLVVTPEGHKVGRLDPVFKGIEGIKEAQIIQHSLDRLEVLIVPSQNDNQQEINLPALEGNIKSRTSLSMNIQFSFTDEIPKTSRGKFKSVISHLSQ